MERGPCYYPFPRECCKMQNCNAYFYHAFKYLIAPSVRVRGISPFHLRIFFKNAIHEGIKIPGKKELPFYFFFFLSDRALSSFVTKLTPPFSFILFWIHTIIERLSTQLDGMGFS